MATITMTIDDSIYPRVRDDISGQYGYQKFIGTDDQGNPIPNPQSSDDFFGQVLSNIVFNSVQAFETKNAVIAAQQQTASNVQGTIIITTQVVAKPQVAPPPPI